MRLLLIIKTLLIAAGLVLTNNQVVEQLVRFLVYDLYFPLAVFFGIWALSLIAIFYIAFTPRVAERIAWSVVFCVAAVLGETYFLVVYERLTIFALDTMWGPGQFTLDTLAFYGNYLLEALARTLPLFAGLLLPWRDHEKLSWKGLTIIPLIPLGLVCGLVYYVGGAQSNETRGMPSQFLVPGLISVFVFSGPEVLEKRPVDIPILQPAMAKHIVLLVDESVSGDFIDLNFQRGVTPFLLSQAGSIINFGPALSASNCSNASNAILRLGANPDQLGSGYPSVLSNPSIWKYAAHAGFETNFIEAQSLVQFHLDFMNSQELDLIDHIETFDTTIDLSQRDQQLPEQIATILSRPNPQFIYVNKFGAHFPYHLAYPPDEAVFSPVMVSFETIDDRERLVNTYKNAVLWSVDIFFENLIEQVDLTNTVLLYTSDHGQSLLDDDFSTTHCRRKHVNPFEAIVPMLVWTDNEQLHREFAQAAEINYGRASHFEIFPTILELFGYDPLSVSSRYHGSLLRRIDDPLGFTSGPVIGRFDQKTTWHPRGDIVNLKR